MRQVGGEAYQRASKHPRVACTICKPIPKKFKIISELHYKSHSDVVLHLS